MITNAYILTNTLQSGGAEKQSIMLARALQNNYSTCLVVYYGDQSDSKLKDLASRYGVNVVWLHGSHVKKILRLFRLFRQNRNAIIFSYLATTNLLNAMIGWLAGVRFRIGGIRNAELPANKLFLQRFLHNHLLTSSVFNNYAGLDELGKRGFNPAKAVVIHNGIEITQPLKEFKSNPPVIGILSVGRFVTQKDYHTAIDAFILLSSLIRADNIEAEITYTIIGYGALESDIRAYIAQNGFEEKIDVVINPPDLTEYYARADIYLSASLFEGLSNSIMEAMEFSLPVVATDVGDNKYLVKHGMTGFLTKVRAKDDIASCLYKLVMDHALLQGMGKAGYDHLKENFSDLAFQKKYVQLIESLSNARKA